MGLLLASAAPVRPWQQHPANAALMCRISLRYYRDTVVCVCALAKTSACLPWGESLILRRGLTPGQTRASECKAALTPGGAAQGWPTIHRRPQAPFNINARLPAQLFATAISIIHHWPQVVRHPSTAMPLGPFATAIIASATLCHCTQEADGGLKLASQPPTAPPSFVVEVAGAHSSLPSLLDDLVEWVQVSGCPNAPSALRSPSCIGAGPVW